MSQEITLLNTGQVLARVAIARPTLYRWIAEGKFPKPQKLKHTNRDFWQKPVIDAWFEENLSAGVAS